MRFRLKKSESGFTLVELLTAGAIMALILGAVFIALSQTMSSIEHSREYLRRIRLVDLVFNRLQREIMSAFYPPDDQEIVFFGKDKGVGDFAEDTLKMVARIGALSHLVDGGLYQVTYSLRDSASPEGKQLIWEAAPLRGGEVGEPRELILGEGIQGLNFQYYHQKGWHDSFDARSYGILPQAVRIELGMLTDKDVQWQRLVVEIPAGGPKLQ